MRALRYSDWTFLVGRILLLDSQGCSRAIPRSKRGRTPWPSIAARPKISANTHESLLAAITLEHGGTLVTRNIKDFREFGLFDVIDPTMNA